MAHLTDLDWAQLEDEHGEALTQAHGEPTWLLEAWRLESEAERRGEDMMDWVMGGFNPEDAGAYAAQCERERQAHRELGQ